MGSAYAAQIEKDVGVKVTLNDFAIGISAQLMSLMLCKPGTSSIPKLEDLPAALMNADVIVLDPGPLGSLPPATFVNTSTCMGNIIGTPEPCAPDGYVGYTADLEAIWIKIFEYRAGKPTILRGMDDATPFVHHVG